MITEQQIINAISSYGDIKGVRITEYKVDIAIENVVDFDGLDSDIDTLLSSEYPNEVLHEHNNTVCRYTHTSNVQKPIPNDTGVVYNL
jgi:hypothetical protein